MTEAVDYPAGNNVKLIVNFIIYLFSRNKGRNHNKLTDTIEYPAVISIIKFSQPEVIIQINNGFN